MPQTPDHKLKSIVPRLGQRVHVLVGSPIYFDDLFKKYEADRRQGVQGDGFTWESDAAEKKLYSAITRRIELALLALEKKCYADLDSARTTSALTT
ncbi:hypothetical protein DYB36_008119 [Aphanomyces astaci]|nr:hypothetical protein DYB36_008119 [Aphanomyces astaci]